MIQQVKNQDAYDKSDSSESNQKPEENLNQGMWEQQQILKFMVFSSYNINILTSQLQRRTVKIFKEMARFISTRTSTQCRSQNQKFIKKHKNIKRVLKAYEAEIGKSEFQKALAQYSVQLRDMNSIKKKIKEIKAKNYVSVFVQTQFPEDSQQLKDETIKMEQQGNPVRASQQRQIYPFACFPHFGNAAI